MCGRFAAFWDDQAIGYKLDADPQPGLPGPSWNVAPTQTVAVAVQGKDGIRRLAPAYWTLIPPQSPTRDPGFPTFNARSETVLVRPTFRAAANGFRSIFPVSGYYEWDKHHTPWYFSDSADFRSVSSSASRSHALWIAGLCSWWRDPRTGRWLLTATILTRDAVGKAATVHNRMPVLVPDKLIDPWLDRSVPGSEILPSVRQSSERHSKALSLYEIAPLHGDGPHLLDPISPPSTASAHLPLASRHGLKKGSSQPQLW